MRPAIERAVQELVHPVVERSIKICLTTAEMIVKKVNCCLSIWGRLLEAWLALTGVKYHGNLYVLVPLNQRLGLYNQASSNQPQIVTGGQDLKSSWFVWNIRMKRFAYSDSINGARN